MRILSGTPGEARSRSNVERRSGPGEQGRGKKRIEQMLCYDFITIRDSGEVEPAVPFQHESYMPDAKCACSTERETPAAWADVKIRSVKSSLKPEFPVLRFRFYFPMQNWEKMLSSSSSSLSQPSMASSRPRAACSSRLTSSP